MANFYLKKGNSAEVDIENIYGLRITSVRGLEPPQPKELYTRDWASEHGVYYYTEPYVEGVSGRKRKPSEVVMTLWIEDHPTDPTKTALKRYKTFCDFVFDGTFVYRDTLQGMQATILYQGNKPSWYQLAGNGQIMAEITFLNPSGAVTLYVAP